MNTDNRDIRVRFKVEFQTGRKGRRRLGPKRTGEGVGGAISAGRLPRVTRLMALAIRFNDLIEKGEVRDYAEIARLGHITRARVTQTMNLLHLAPSIQEAILHLPSIKTGRDQVTERHLRRISAIPDWTKQRCIWLSQRTCDGALQCEQQETPSDAARPAKGVPSGIQ
jgi:hypothetical protein